MKISVSLIAPLITTFVVYMTCYELPKVLVDYKRLRFFELDIDKRINLYSPAVVIYIGAFFQWLNFAFVIITQEKQIAYQILSMIIIGSIIGFLVFTIFPTAIHRTEIKENSIFDRLLKLVYACDNIVCACPSFHCFVSTIVVIGLFLCNGISTLTIVLNVVFSILVFISTLLTKQHYVIDIPGGIVLGLISFCLSNIIKFDWLFEIINSIFM